MTTVLHPCLDENGKPVVVAHPTQPTSRDTWLDSRCTATLSRTAEPDLPDSVNGLAFTTNLGIPEEDPWYWRDVVPDAVTGEPDFVMPPGFSRHFRMRCH